MTAPQPPLAQVQCTLQRADPRVLHLQHVADLISSCLDTSVLLTPPQAARDSASLFERVLRRVVNDPTVDAAFFSHWLARAMEIAIQQNDLTRVQLIHGVHPAPLAIHTLELALQHGSLEVVRWIVLHRSDRLCCAPGIRNLCPQSLKLALLYLGDRDPDRIVEWLIAVGLRVVDPETGLSMMCLRTRSTKLLRWLDARGEIDGANIRSVFSRAMQRGDTASLGVLQFVIDRGFTPDKSELIKVLTRVASHRPCEAAMDLVVSSRLCDPIRDQFVWASPRLGGRKVLQWDTSMPGYGKAMENLLAQFAHNACNVDTLEWLRRERGVLHHSPRDARNPQIEADLLAVYEWMYKYDIDGWCEGDLACAARKGYFSAIQWLHAHKPEILVREAVDIAALNGHLHIVEWLYANRTERCKPQTLMTAATNGLLHMVQWLSANETAGDANHAIAGATMGGQLEVVAWLCANRVDSCGACVLDAVLRAPEAFYGVGKYSTSPLNTIRWLRQHGTRSSACHGSCVRACMPRSSRMRAPTQTVEYSLALEALSVGDLDLARYVLEHHGDSLWATADHACVPTYIVMSGHMGVIQWLEATYPGRLRWDLVTWDSESHLEYIRSEQPDVVAWLETTVGLNPPLEEPSPVIICRQRSEA